MDFSRYDTELSTLAQDFNVSLKLSSSRIPGYAPLADNVRPNPRSSQNALNATSSLAQPHPTSPKAFVSDAYNPDNPYLSSSIDRYYDFSDDDVEMSPSIGQTKSSAGTFDDSFESSPSTSLRLRSIPGKSRTIHSAINSSKYSMASPQSSHSPSVRPYSSDNRLTATIPDSNLHATHNGQLPSHNVHGSTYGSSQPSTYNALTNQSYVSNGDVPAKTTIMPKTTAAPKSILKPSPTLPPAPTPPVLTPLRFTIALPRPVTAQLPVLKPLLSLSDVHSSSSDSRKEIYPSVPVFSDIPAPASAPSSVEELAVTIAAVIGKNNLFPQGLWMGKSENGEKNPFGKTHPSFSCSLTSALSSTALPALVPLLSHLSRILGPLHPLTVTAVTTVAKQTLLIAHQASGKMEEILPENDESGERHGNPRKKDGRHESGDGAGSNNSGKNDYTESKFSSKPRPTSGKTNHLEKTAKSSETLSESQTPVDYAVALGLYRQVLSLTSVSTATPCVDGRMCRHAITRALCTSRTHNRKAKEHAEGGEVGRGPQSGKGRGTEDAVLLSSPSFPYLGSSSSRSAPSTACSESALARVVQEGARACYALWYECRQWSKLQTQAAFTYNKAILLLSYAKWSHICAEIELGLSQKYCLGKNNTSPENSLPKLPEPSLPPPPSARDLQPCMLPVPNIPPSPSPALLAGTVCTCGCRVDPTWRPYMWYTASSLAHYTATPPRSTASSTNNPPPPSSSAPASPSISCYPSLFSLAPQHTLEQLQTYIHTLSNACTSILYYIQDCWTTIAVLRGSRNLDATVHLVEEILDPINPESGKFIGKNTDISEISWPAWENIHISFPPLLAVTPTTTSSASSTTSTSAYTSTSTSTTSNTPTATVSFNLPSSTSSSLPYSLPVPSLTAYALTWLPHPLFFLANTQSTTANTTTNNSHANDTTGTATDAHVHAIAAGVDAQSSSLFSTLSRHRILAQIHTEALTAIIDISRKRTLSKIPKSLRFPALRAPKPGQRAYRPAPISSFPAPALLSFQDTLGAQDQQIDVCKRVFHGYCVGMKWIMALAEYCGRRWGKIREKERERRENVGISQKFSEQGVFPNQGENLDTAIASNTEINASAGGSTGTGAGTSTSRDVDVDAGVDVDERWSWCASLFRHAHIKQSLHSGDTSADVHTGATDSALSPSNEQSLASVQPLPGVLAIAAVETPHVDLWLHDLLSFISEESVLLCYLHLSLTKEHCKSGNSEKTHVKTEILGKSCRSFETHYSETETLEELAPFLDLFITSRNLSKITQERSKHGFFRSQLGKLVYNKLNSGHFSTTIPAALTSSTSASSSMSPSSSTVLPRSASTTSTSSLSYSSLGSPPPPGNPLLHAIHAQIYHLYAHGRLLNSDAHIDKGTGNYGEVSDARTNTDTDINASTNTDTNIINATTTSTSTPNSAHVLAAEAPTLRAGEEWICADDNLSTAASNKDKHANNIYISLHSPTLQPPATTYIAHVIAALGYPWLVSADMVVQYLKSLINRCVLLGDLRQHEDSIAYGKDLLKFIQKLKNGVEITLVNPENVWENATSVSARTLRDHTSPKSQRLPAPISESPIFVSIIGLCPRVLETYHMLAVYSVACQHEWTGDGEKAMYLHKKALHLAKHLDSVLCACACAGTIVNTTTTSTANVITTTSTGTTATSTSSTTSTSTSATAAPGPSPTQLPARPHCVEAALVHHLSNLCHSALAQLQVTPLEKAPPVHRAGTRAGRSVSVPASADSAFGFPAASASVPACISTRGMGTGRVASAGTGRGWSGLPPSYAPSTSSTLQHSRAQSRPSSATTQTHTRTRTSASQGRYGVHAHRHSTPVPTSVSAGRHGTDSEGGGERQGVRRPQSAVRPPPGYAGMGTRMGANSRTDMGW